MLNKNFVFLRLRGKLLLALAMSALFVSLLANILWNIFTGGIGFYPRVELFRERPCGGYHLDTHPFLEVGFGNCFITNDSEKKVDQWYRQRGWFRFGEQSLPQAINFGLFRLLITRYFLTEKQSDGALLIVHNVQYVIGPPCLNCISNP